ncbi:unnamed protein product [Ambrosiozyma monospora]|uniref:Unnamed protein product n=1 Tax=Ambrosiozyma monospora TaxID=43982 RepID=A0ACB5TUL1_AMBMO|nr:unnamed protein product [Ambrosiozyma monospora]
MDVDDDEVEEESLPVLLRQPSLSQPESLVGPSEHVEKEVLSQMQSQSQILSQSQDWGSLDDREFISLVNQLSQEKSLMNRSKNKSKLNDVNNYNDTLARENSTFLKSINEESDVPDDIDNGRINRSLLHDLSVAGNEEGDGNVVDIPPPSQKQPQQGRETEEEEHENPFSSLLPSSLDSEQGGAKEPFEFGDYATYFHNKQAGQQEQDDIYVDFVKKALQSETHPPIFKGCIIYVNGKTNPDISQLHKLIILHGGKFLHYLGSKGAATHIIADHLTPRKKLEFRNYKVVKAS